MINSIYRKRKFQINGQAALEYLGLIIVVTIALFALTMRGFLQQAVQAQWKASAAPISEVEFDSDPEYSMTQKVDSLEVKSGSTPFDYAYDTGLEHYVWSWN